MRRSNQPNFGKLNLEDAKLVDRSCGKKKQYHNRNLAKQKLNEAINRGVEGLQIYRCNFARHYHLGHKRRSNV